MTMFLSAGLIISLSGLLVFHTYIIVTNTSTIDAAVLGEFNPFDRVRTVTTASGAEKEVRDWRGNVADYYGPDCRTWLLPLAPQDRGCDGYHWKIKKVS